MKTITELSGQHKCADPARSAGLTMPLGDRGEFLTAGRPVEFRLQDQQPALNADGSAARRL